MRKQITTICILILISYCALGQTWEWGAIGNGTIKANDLGAPVVTDQHGNAYISGGYETVVIFGTDTLKGGNNNAYLVKYNSAGNVLWAEQPIDSAGAYSYSSSATIDKIGNVYITGLFYGTISFGTTVLHAPSLSGSGSVFIAKYSTSGNLIWAKQAVIPTKYSNGEGYSLTCDKNNDILVTGSFADTISFGSYTLLAPYTSFFLVKYDSSGNVMWAKCPAAYTKNANQIAYSVCSDDYNNIYVSGIFYDTLIISKDTLKDNSLHSVFLAKYSSNGNALWGRQGLGTKYKNCYSQGYAVKTDDLNNPYITGYFTDTVSFGIQSLFSSYVITAFLAKYDTSGVVLWAKASSPGWAGTSISADQNNHIYLGGMNEMIYDTLKFGGYTLPFNPGRSVYASFITEFDLLGNPLCGSLLYNVGNCPMAEQVASDSTGQYIYLAGTMVGDTVICINDTLVHNSGDANFLGRWNKCGVNLSINKLSNTSDIKAYPNPSNGIFNLSIRNQELGIKYNVQVYDVFGRQLYSQPFKIQNSTFKIDLSGQPSGIYLCRLLDENGALVGETKLIVQ